MISPRRRRGRSSKSSLSFTSSGSRGGAMAPASVSDTRRSPHGGSRPGSRMRTASPIASVATSMRAPALGTTSTRSWPDSGTMAIRALSSIAGSPGGSLWLYDEEQHAFVCREGWQVRLDARPVRTPAKAALTLPSAAMAEAIAAAAAALS